MCLQEGAWCRRTLCQAVELFAKLLRRCQRPLPQMEATQTRSAGKSWGVSPTCAHNVRARA